MWIAGGLFRRTNEESAPAQIDQDGGLFLGTKEAWGFRLSEASADRLLAEDAGMGWRYVAGSGRRQGTHPTTTMMKSRRFHPLRRYAFGWKSSP